MRKWVGEVPYIFITPTNPEARFQLSKSSFSNNNPSLQLLISHTHTHIEERQWILWTNKRKKLLKKKFIGKTEIVLQKHDDKALSTEE